jgi:hypothetical protein
MVARAVSARNWLAPLAVLVPILATVVGGCAVRQHEMLLALGEH